MTIPGTSAIVGAGTMGPGMAAVLARAGSQVRLNDVSPEVLDRAKAATGLAAQVLDRVGAPLQPGGSVSYEPGLKAAVSGADLVIEAVPEKIEIKRAVFAELRSIRRRRRSSRRTRPASPSPTSPGTYGTRSGLSECTGRTRRT